jgi:Tol biopolymer transport system component
LALTPGTRLGVYDITALIGEGGMGHVYRARDTKLDRDVAIKILPEAFAHDADRLARFQREAKTLASLNHPHIAGIYGLEENGGVSALVMELVEGDDLSQRIARGAIALDEALPIALQIAQALEAAHERGIIHRDLKPANIKVRADGRVKVLDFGLAKAIEPASALRASAGQALSRSPTITTPAMTQAGMILGTAAYMSPEQAEGRATDKRTDIWAFGVVFYELLSGRRLFEGNNVQATLAQVLTKEPDLSSVPVRARRLLARCLERDPARRLRDIGDAAAWLEPDLPLTPPSRSWPWPAVAAIAMIAIAVLAYGQFRRVPVPAPAAFRFQIPLADAGTPADGTIFAFSPDGRALTYSGSGGKVWLHVLGALEPTLLLGPDAKATGGTPFWSHDSKSLFYVAEGQLKRIDIRGGGVQRVCGPGGLVLGGTENNDGVVLFGVASSAGVMKVASSGGTPESVTRPGEADQERHLFPFFLPDGDHFLYLRVTRTPEDSGIYVGALSAAPEAQTRTRLVATSTGAQFAPGPNGVGTLLFLRDGSLMAQAFDPSALELKGDAALVAEGVGNTRAYAYFASSLSGSLVYRATPTPTRQMTWFDRDGRAIGDVGEPIPLADPPMLSPSGSQFAVSQWDASDHLNDLFLYTLSPYRMVRLVRGPSLNESPVWTADTTRVTYASRRGNHYDIYQTDANGDGRQTALLESADSKFPNSWSRDHYLIYLTTGTSTGLDLWLLPPSGKPFPFLASPAREFDARFSPDGRWIAYLSDESGVVELYARSFTPAAGGGQPAIGLRVPVSSRGASMPRWRGDGRELFFVAPNGDLMSVAITEVAASASPATLQVGRPVRLFPAPSPTNWDAAPDGQRFLFAMPVGPQAMAPFTVVVNWQAPSPP